MHCTDQEKLPESWGWWWRRRVRVIPRNCLNFGGFYWEKLEKPVRGDRNLDLNLSVVLAIACQSIHQSVNHLVYHSRWKKYKYRFR